MSNDTENRLSFIEARLTRIEEYLSVAPQEPVAPPAEESVDGPWAQAQAAYVDSPRSSAGLVQKPGNWLGLVSVICFVLAAGFIVKLSIESGWLTHARQIGLAALFGFGLIGAGFAFIRMDREYAAYLPAAGIIVLYLSVFAAHRYYLLISFESALALISMVSALCIWLYTKIRHDIYPIIAAVGAYVSPEVSGLSTDAEFSLFYFLLCSIAFSTISIWVKSRTLTVISAYLAILMSGVVGFEIYDDMLVAVMLALQFIVFAVGAYLYTTQNKQPMSEREAWSFLPVLLTFYAMEYYFIEQIQPGLAPWISLGFAAVLTGLYVGAKKYFPDNLASQSLVLAFTTLVFFHSVYLELLPATLRSWLFVAIMLGVAFAPAHLNVRKKGRAYYIPLLAALAILGIEYVTMLFHLFDAGGTSWLVVSMASFASLWVVIVKSGDQLNAKETYGNSLLVGAHLLAIVGLYRLTTDIGSLAVSASWLFYAVGVMAFAFHRKDEIMAKSALFVLAFAAGKALLYDAASAPTIIRIMCLLLTGAVLYGCGLLMRKIAHWKTP